MIRELLTRRLATRLAGAFLALSLGTLVLASVISYRSAESALRARLEERLEAFARDDAAELSEWLNRHREALRFLSTLPVAIRAADGDTAGFGRIVRGLDPELFAADEVQILSVPGGRVLFSTDSSQVGAYAVQQLYYLEGRNRSMVQSIYPRPRDGLPTLTVATPIAGADGQTAAVLVAHLSLDRMERVIAKPQHGVTIDAYLVSRTAEFVSAERFVRGAQRRGVQSRAIESAVSGASGVGLYTDYAGRAVVGAWRWLPDLELGLILESPQNAAFKPARALFARSMLVGLLAASLLTIGVLFIVRRVTDPILALGQAAERVAAGDFDAEVPAPGDDEVGALSRAFNAMTARLRTLYGELAEQVDATSRALTEAHDSRALLQDVVDNSATAVLVIGVDGRVRLANQRVAELSDVSLGALLGRPYDQVGGAFLPLLVPILEEASVAEAALTREMLVTQFQERHTWQVVAFPLRDETGDRYGTGVVATDLSERARLEEERRVRDAGLQQQQRLESLGIMAGGIAHDFNNLLGAILGNVELARLSSSEPAEVQQALEQIGTAAKRAAELTRQMLAYAGRASLRRETIDARKVFTDIVPLVRASQSRKIDFVIEGFSEPLWVTADPAQLSQVALNLLTNAAEAIGDRAGQVLLRGTHEVTVPAALVSDVPASPLGWIHLRVRDSGEGMSAEVLQRIFDPFFTTKRDGRGLGLSAVRGIVRSAGGTLHVSSAPGVGTTFDVYLPSSTATTAAEEQPSTTPTGHRTGVVLVVDDEAALRSIARRALERQGLRVVEAVDGVDGLEKFEQYQDVLTLVMLDITMPGRNGVELLAEIRKRKPEIPAIIASGYDRPDELSPALRDDRTRFLQKPFELSALRETVAQLVKRQREA